MRAGRRQSGDIAGGRAARTGASRLHVVGPDVYPDWEAIYRDNVGRVYRAIYDRVGNRADAEDLTTEVFLAALRPLRTSASVGEVRAYLLTTARTVLASHWRRTLGRELTTLDDQDVAEVFAEADHDPRRADRVTAILAALPENYRRILQLRFLDGRSVRESAAEMDVTVSNAKVLQYRALRAAADAAGRIGG